MCIICAKPSGAEMISNETLKNCWENNSDGAGICYSRAGSGKVNILKGFMKYKHLYRALCELNFGVDDDVIIHFRWATHGLVDRGNCHPFPLSSDINELRCLEGEFPVGITHNGVFNTMPLDEKLSDTQKFISMVMMNIDINSEAVQELLSGYCGNSSKLAILKNDGLLLIGNFIKDKGIYYSNTDYKPRVYQQYEDNVWKGYAGVDDCKIASRIEDECILCGNMNNVEFYENEECFLCSDCMELNLRNNRGVLNDNMSTGS